MPANTTTLQEFESVWPKLQAAILEHAQSYKLPQGETEWFKLVCGRRAMHFQSIPAEVLTCE